MRADLKRFGLHALLTLFFLLCVDASFPADTQEHPDGFWFGTQSLLCMTSKADGPLARLISKRSTSSKATPYRNGLHYIHRLIFYKDTVFEWGTGVRGYHWGQAASVTDCPVTWERSSAGRGHCPVEAVINFTRLYRNRFGPYHLLTNNCHHFTNRVSALLSDPGCGAGRRNRGVSDGVVSTVERSIWKAISFVLSYVAPVPSAQAETRDVSSQDTEFIVD